jgi:hypothetical protein
MNAVTEFHRDAEKIRQDWSAQRAVTARDIIANPEPFARTPWIYSRAWSYLLADKGREVRPIPGGPKHRIKREKVDIPARVREIAKAKGYKTRPAPAK